MTLHVVLVENSHSGGCDILGGVFSTKALANKYIKANRLEDQGYDYEVVRLDQWHYVLIDED